MTVSHKIVNCLFVRPSVSTLLYEVLRHFTF